MSYSAAGKGQDRPEGEGPLEIGHILLNVTQGLKTRRLSLPRY